MKHGQFDISTGEFNTEFEAPSVCHLFNSSSKVENTYAYDERQDNLNVQNEGDVDGVNLSGIKVGSGGDTNISVVTTTTDHGALDGAFDLADRAITAAENAGAATVNFAADALKGSLQFADRQNERVVTSISGAADAAVKATQRAADQSAAFAAGALQAQAAGYERNTQALVGTFQGSLKTLENFGASAFEGLDNAFDSSLEVLAGSIDKVTRATTENIQVAADATRSETADSFNRLIKYGAIAATVIAIAIIATRKGAL